MRARIVAAIAVALALVPAVARPAEEPPWRRVPGFLEVAGQRDSKTRLTFGVPHGWPQARGIEQPVFGVYKRIYELRQGGICRVTLVAYARLRRHPPVARAGRLRDGVSILPITRTDVAADGTPTWTLGPEPEVVDEVGSMVVVRPAPPGLGPRHLGVLQRYVSVATDLERFGPKGRFGYPGLEPTDAQERACPRIGRKALRRLGARVLSSIRVAPL